MKRKFEKKEIKRMIVKSSKEIAKTRVELYEKFGIAINEEMSERIYMEERDSLIKDCLGVIYDSYGFNEVLEVITDDLESIKRQCASDHMLSILSKDELETHIPRYNEHKKRA